MTEVLWTRSPRVMAGSGSASSSSDRAKAASSSSGSSTGRNRSGDYPDFENLFSFLPGSQLLGKWYVNLNQEVSTLLSLFRPYKTQIVYI